jgi:hypothetical protein
MYATRNLSLSVIFAIAVLLSISLACGSSPVVPTQSISTTVQEQVVNAPEVTKTPNPTNTSFPPTATENPYLFKPGTYLVGSDIQPGIYRGEAGIDFTDSCYWKRLRDLSGTLDSIIANNNSIGQFYIEILSSDYAISTDCELVLLESLPAPTGGFPIEITPGMYLVGRDIQPGLYKGQAGADFSESCYWKRLSNVVGDLDSILANDNATGQFYIQVAATDFALFTDCELQRVDN